MLPRSEVKHVSSRMVSVVCWITLAGVWWNRDPLLYLLQRGRRRRGGRGGVSGARFGPAQRARGRTGQGAGGAVVSRWLMGSGGVGTITRGVLLGGREFLKAWLCNQIIFWEKTPPWMFLKFLTTFFFFLSKKVSFLHWSSKEEPQDPKWLYGGKNHF